MLGVTVQILRSNKQINGATVVHNECTTHSLFADSLRSQFIVAVVLLIRCCIFIHSKQI